MMVSQRAQTFFEEYIGQKADEFKILAQSGSARINFLAKASGKSYIITYNENLRENEAFFYFSDIFSALKLNTPEIYKIIEDRKFYIQEFLGENTLSEVIAKEGLSTNVKALVKQTLEKLFSLQQKTAGKINYQNTFEYKQYDDLPVMHDLYYFKNFLIDVLEIPYHKSVLLEEFKRITSHVVCLQPRSLMIRDFQARNIMVNAAGDVSFIDYQSAMEGPAMYDVISLLYQAKANFPEDFRQEMLDFYISQFTEKEEKNQLKNSVKILQLMRYLQVLGAYGFRGLVQRKSHFINSLDQGIKNIIHFSESWEEMDNFPELQMLINKLGQDETKEKISKLVDFQ